MANRFMDSFNSYQQQQVPSQDIFTQFNQFRQDPYSMLSQRGIDIPQQYRGSYGQAAQYLMQNMSQNQQNGIFQKVNMLKSMMGFR